MSRFSFSEIFEHDDVLMLESHHESELLQITNFLIHVLISGRNQIQFARPRVGLCLLIDILFHIKLKMLISKIINIQNIFLHKTNNLLWVESYLSFLLLTKKKFVNFLTYIIIENDKSPSFSVVHFVIKLFWHYTVCQETNLVFHPTNLWLLN